MLKNEDIELIVSKNWAVTPINHILPNGECNCKNFKGPCACKGKHTIIGNWQNNIFRDANRIKKIWSNNSWSTFINKDGEEKPLKGNENYNIALLTGKINDLVIIDIDNHKGIDGEETFKQLENILGPLPATPESITGGGGRQLFFKYPLTHNISCRIGIADGIDIKADGGYVLIEPSITSNRYNWNCEYHPSEIEFAELPQSWIEFITQKREKVNDKNCIIKKFTEGNRNNCLFKLGSSYRAKGMSNTTLKISLENENLERCSPPLPTKEVEQIVNSIINYEIGNVDIKDIEDAPKIDTTIENSFGELPPGLISDLTNYYMKSTDGERDFIIAAIIHSISIVVNKRVRINFGNGTVSLLLWQTILAKSGFMRKSTSLNIVKSIFRETKSGGYIASDMSSPETFLEVLSRHNSNIKLIMKNEMSQLLKDFGKSYMIGFKEFLIDSFDMPDIISKDRKGGKGNNVKSFIVREPYISILGASVEQTFMEQLNENDMLGGFLPRFLFVRCRKRTRNIMHYPKVSEQFPKDAIDKFYKIKNLKSVRLDLDANKETLEIYISWCEKVYADTQQTENMVLESFASRYVIYLIKLSILFEVVRAVENDITEITEITPQSMQWAISFMDVYWTNAKNLVLGGEFTFSEFSKERKKIIDMLLDAKGKSMPRSKLLKNSHMKVKDFELVLDTLEQSGEVKIIDKEYHKKTIIKLVQ